MPSLNQLDEKSIVIYLVMKNEVTGLTTEEEIFRTKNDPEMYSFICLVRILAKKINNDLPKLIIRLAELKRTFPYAKDLIDCLSSSTGVRTIELYNKNLANFKILDVSYERHKRLGISWDGGKIESDKCYTELEHEVNQIIKFELDPIVGTTLLAQHEQISRLTASVNELTNALSQLLPVKTKEVAAESKTPVIEKESQEPVSEPVTNVNEPEVPKKVKKSK